MLCAVVQLTEH